MLVTSFRGGCETLGPPHVGEGGVLQQEKSTHSLAMPKAILKSNGPHCKNVQRLD